MKFTKNKNSTTNMGQKTSTIGTDTIITDKFTTYSEIEQCLRELQIDKFQSMFFIDFSKSNLCRDNHQIDHFDENPYFQVLSSIRSFIHAFDHDQVFPTYRFGCVKTRDSHVLPLTYPENAPQNLPEQPNITGFDAVINAYKEATQQVTFCGPTALHPAIQKAIEYSKANPKQHILCFIICDGGTCSPHRDYEATIEASNYPISFILVSTGPVIDENLEKLDDILGRKFDNLQYVNFSAVKKQIQERFLSGERMTTIDNTLRAVRSAADKFLAVHLFQEIPDQHVWMVKLGYLQETDKIKKNGVYTVGETVQSAVSSSLVYGDHE